VTGEIVTAWILTFPVCFGVGWIVVKAVRVFSG
jgi:phosphate/sulfate permease